MTRAADSETRMAAALAAITAYIDSERVEVLPERSSRWAIAGRLEAQQSGARHTRVGSGWGRRDVR